jgi:hypothetical protein
MRTQVALLSILLAASASAAPYRGHLYVGPENEAFYPCGSKVGYWFTSTTAVRKKLLSEGLAKSDAFSEQGVYVEIEGSVGRKTREADGHAYSYPAYFHIRRVNAVHRVSERGCKR